MLPRVTPRQLGLQGCLSTAPAVPGRVGRSTAKWREWHARGRPARVGRPCRPPGDLGAAVPRPRGADPPAEMTPSLRPLANQSPPRRLIALQQEPRAATTMSRDNESVRWLMLRRRQPVRPRHDGSGRYRFGAADRAATGRRARSAARLAVRIRWLAGKL